MWFDYNVFFKGVYTPLFFFNMEHLLIEVLPENDQIVLIQIFYLPGLWVKAKWLNEEQQFVVSNSGLFIKGNYVIYWKLLEE